MMAPAPDDVERLSGADLAAALAEIAGTLHEAATRLEHTVTAIETADDEADGGEERR